MSTLQPIAENINEQDIKGSHDEFQPPVIELASVGWDDAADWYDQGDGSAGQGGPTLIKVQLVRGRQAGSGSPTTDGQAQGHKLLAQIGGPMWVIPPKGQRVLVAFPTGFSVTPGAAVIVSWVGASPPTQFSPNRAKLDFTGYDLIIKARSLTFSTTDNRFISVGPDGGVLIMDKDGTGVVINSGALVLIVPDGSQAGKTVVQMTATEFSAFQADGSAIKLKGGNVTFTGNSCALACGSIGLGSHASPATPVVVGPTGMTGIGSTSIFGQP